MSNKPACPICGAPPAPAHQPFCSQGCRDRDLLNWLGEAYAVPARPTEAEDEEGADRISLPEPKLWG